MPIYEYACSSCGFEKDYLQKMSEPVLTECPNCNQSTLYKKISAPSFQLKGSGWYATDFKGNKSAPSSSPSAEAAPSEGTTTPAAPAPESSSSSGGGHACGQGACGACAT